MSKKHFDITDFSSDNYRYYVEKPDPDFSPEHNYAVIQQTIDEYEQMRNGLTDKTKAASEDRADILASFAKYKLDQGGEKKVEEWLGKQRINELYGEALLEKIRIMESVSKFKKIKGN